MAKLYITERKFNTEGFGGAFPIEGPYVDDQEITIGVEAKSAAFSQTTEYVSLFAEAKCKIMIGTNPTAKDSAGQGEYIGAGERTQRAVKAGEKISVVTVA